MVQQQGREWQLARNRSNRITSSSSMDSRGTEMFDARVLLGFAVVQVCRHSGCSRRVLAGYGLKVKLTSLVFGH